MSKTSKPRRGSLQFVPRKRAKRIYPKLKVKPIANKIFGGFAGYKVGMLSVKMIENRKGSVNYGKEVVVPATLIEVPDLFVFGVRVYEPLPYGYKAVGEVWNFDPIKKYLSRKITLPKGKYEKSIDDLSIMENHHVRALISTQPWKAGIRKKTPEVFEVPLYGSIDDVISFVKDNLGKEISVDSVFKAGDFIDVSSVTKGKGFQGSVKRFGVKLQKRGKTDKVARRVGTLGPWHPARTSWRVPQHGQLGFHTRTEYNKMIIEVGDSPERVNKSSGWEHYGVVRSKYIILKGSVPGPAKRLIMMRHAIRPVDGKYDEIQVEKLLW